MRRFQFYGNPGEELFNRTVRAVSEGCAQVFTDFGSGAALPGLRLYFVLDSPYTILANDYTVIVNESGRRPKYDAEMKRSINGTAQLAHRSRSALLRFFGRGDYGLDGYPNVHGFGHDGLSLIEYNDGAPWISTPLPISIYGGGPDDVLVAGLWRSDYWDGFAYDGVSIVVDTEAEPVPYTDLGNTFPDSLDFVRTDTGATVRAGWGAARNGSSFYGVRWIAGAAANSYRYQAFPFTESSADIGGLNEITVANGSVRVDIAVQPLDFNYQQFGSATGRPLFAMLGDDEQILEAKAEVKITSYTRTTTGIRYTVDASGVVTEEEYEEVDSGDTSFVLVGRQRVGVGVRAGYRWDLLGSTPPSPVVSDKFQVIDATELLQQYHNVWRSSRYDVIGVFPTAALSVWGNVKEQADALLGLLEPMEFTYYRAPSRTTAGARDGAAYLKFGPEVGGPGFATENVDKIVPVKTTLRSIYYGSISFARCWVKRRRRDGTIDMLDAVGVNAPPLGATE